MIQSPQFTNRFLLLLLVLYAMMSLLTLTRFPLMHSDESWLSGLSRHILVTGNIAATEPCFDLNPRLPHAFKILFHGLQILSIKLLGYHLFSVRSLSLIFGLFTLIFFYKLGKLILPAKKWALLSCSLLGIDVQFIYASHFGRQEIILLFLGVCGLYYLQKKRNRSGYGRDLLLGTVAGLGIGIHPNGFLIAIMLGAVYLFHIRFSKTLKFRNLSFYSLIFLLWTGIFIGLSFSFKPDFIANYLAYGQQQFGVLNPFIAKLGRLGKFYQHIYQQRCGTYYGPHIEIDLIFLGIGLLYAIGKPLISRVAFDPFSTWIILALLSFNLGMILIGRFNYTSIIFLFPFYYLLTTNIIGSLPHKHQFWVSGMFFLLILSNTIWNMSSFMQYDYSSYLHKIAGTIGPERKVLASLNTEYDFADGALLDFRNLSYLKKYHLSFADYVRSRQIEYIIYPEGLDFIYRSRPQWNGVFGPLPYYNDLKKFLGAHCRPLYRFTDAAFGIEIAQYVGGKNWQIIIYRVLPASDP